ncbi:glycosyltransferase [candidate division KSB1 bacterium]|nr:glycosyltransferase [candidate division KSB1 bacterium]
MRIGYVHSTPFPSLAANVVQVVQMCRAWGALGHHVTLFIPRADAYSDSAAALAAAAQMFGGALPFEVEYVARKRLWGRLDVLGSVDGTISAIRARKPDLVYTRNPWSVEFLPRTGTPFVFEAHEEHVHVKSHILDLMLRNMIVRASQRPSCACVVAISAALARIWEGYGVPRSKLLAAHDGVDAELFGLDLPAAAARAELSSAGFAGLSPAGRVVVYTGALRADRGVDQMLRAAQRLDTLTFFFIGGTDQELAQCRKSAADLGLRNVHFPGRVAHREIPHWLAAADILLMMWTSKVPTMRGASPMKMFEYMAADRLIVGPAFPTIREVLENDKDAVLFQPDDAEALIAGLEHACALLDSGGAASLARSAREKVRRDYTWRTRCQRILAALPPLEIPLHGS